MLVKRETEYYYWFSHKNMFHINIALEIHHDTVFKKCREMPT